VRAYQQEAGEPERQGEGGGRQGREREREGINDLPENGVRGGRKGDGDSEAEGFVV